MGFTVRAPAQSAVRAGVAPLAADAFGDRDLLAVCPDARALGTTERPYSPRALAELARGLRFDAVVYTGALENHPAVVAALAQQVPLWGNAPAVLRAVRDWRQVSRELAAAGFSVPVTLAPGQAVPTAGAWLQKPAAGAGGAGIRVAVAGTVPPRNRLVQEWVQGTPGSALFVGNGKESRLLGVTEQLTARPEFGGRAFQYAGNILLPSPPAALRNRLEALCQFLTARYGLIGLGGVDFVLAGTEPLPVEVNPRYTAAMELVEWASGTSLFDLHVEGCAGRCPPPLPVWSGYYGKAVVYGTGSGVWQFDGDWAAAGLRDVPWPGSPVQVGQPVCTVLAAGPGREACLDELVARAIAVRSDWIAP